jgi:hypothetical protein
MPSLRSSLARDALCACGVGAAGRFCRHVLGGREQVEGAAKMLVVAS